MKRDVPIAPAQLRALVLLLLLLPLVPAALFARLVFEADEMSRQQAADEISPLYLKHMRQAIGEGGSPHLILDRARQLLGSDLTLGVQDRNGRLLAGKLPGRFSLGVLKERIERPNEDLQLTLALDRRATGDGLQGYFLLAAGVGIGVLVIAVMATKALHRQQRIQEIKTDALNVVSHELKTPLSSMRVLIETLQDDRIESADVRRDYLDFLMEENVRMGRILSDFLSLARLERNRKTFCMQAIVAADAVRSAVEEAMPKIEDKGGRIRCFGPADGPVVMGEASSLEAVIAILLDNAVKYARGRPDIEINYFASGGHAYFLVKDRGPGVPREFRRRIFDSFYQVDPKLSRSGGGCGLGLSIAWHVITAHGGQIRHRPRRGPGSVFRFSVPLAAVEEAAA